MKEDQSLQDKRQELKDSVFVFTSHFYTKLTEPVPPGKHRDQCVALRQCARPLSGSVRVESYGLLFGFGSEPKKHASESKKADRNLQAGMESSELLGGETTSKAQIVRKTNKEKFQVSRVGSKHPSPPQSHPPAHH